MAVLGEESRACVGCGEILPLTAYSSSHGSLSPGCNKCVKAARVELSRLLHIPRKTKSINERFDKYYEAVPWSGCWIWTGGTSGDRKYQWAQLNVRRDNGKWIPEPAYRTSWKIHRGEIPYKKWVLHRCDVPLCVNPNHLFLGTPRDNTQDMMSKGRHWTQRINHGRVQ